MNLAIFNTKGGTAKTTTAVNLSSALARMGKKILLVDLCPQGDSTRHFGLLPGGDYNPFWRDNQPLEVMDNLRLLPATPRLLTEHEYGDETQEIAPDLARRGERVIFDCPPALGRLSIAAIMNSKNLLVPVAPSFLSVQAIDVLERVLVDALANGVIQTRPRTYVLLAQYVDQRRVDRAVRGVLEESSELLKTVIPFNTTLTIAPGAGMDIHSYKPNCPGSLAYQQLAEEVVRRGII